MKTNQSQFLILLHQPSGGTPSPEELRKIMARFHTWMDSLKAKYEVLSTNGLANTGKVLRGPKGSIVTDGPYAETNEVVGGYVLITADSFDDAVEAARACPGLDYQMAVEVRPVIQR